MKINILFLLELSLFLVYQISSCSAHGEKKDTGKSPHQHVCTPSSVPLGKHCSEMCIPFRDGSNEINSKRIDKYKEDSMFPCFGLTFFNKFGREDIILIKAGFLVDTEGNVLSNTTTSNFDCSKAIRNGLSPKAFAIQALDANGFPAGVFEYENCKESCKYCRKSGQIGKKGELYYENVLAKENNTEYTVYIDQCRTDVFSFTEYSTFNFIKKDKVIPAVQTLRVEFNRGHRLTEDKNSIWFYWRIDELQFKKVQDTEGSQFSVFASIAFTMEAEFDYLPKTYSSLYKPNETTYIYRQYSQEFKYHHTLRDTKSPLSDVICTDQLAKCPPEIDTECREIHEDILIDAQNDVCCPVNNQYLRETKIGDIPIKEFTISKQQKQNYDLSTIYSGCNATKMCVAGIYYDKPPPSGRNDDDQSCISSKSCEVLLTIGKAYDASKSHGKERNNVLLELYGQTPYWVAIGISKDLKMGDDFVIECVNEGESGGNKDIFLYASFNYINKVGKRQNIRLTEEEYYQIVKLVDYEDNQKEIYCAFLIPKYFKVRQFEFNLDYTNNVIFAMGSSRTTTHGYQGNLHYHDHQHRYFYRKNVTLGSRHSPLPDEQNLLYIHGQMMIAAWIFFLPIGSFIGRYFKQSYLHISILGYKLWLFLHIIFSIVGLAFVFAGYFTLSKSKRDWTFVGTSRDGSLHLWAGLIASSLFFTNMFAGLFVDERSAKRKWLILEWIHGLIGHSAFLAGFSALYATPAVILSDVPCGFNPLMIVWLIIYFIFHCLMSYHFCWIDFVLGRKTRLLCCFFSMKVVFPPGNYRKLTEDEPGTRVRTYMLLAFIGMSIIFWIAAGAVAGKHKACYTFEELVKFSF